MEENKTEVENEVVLTMDGTGSTSASVAGEAEEVVVVVDPTGRLLESAKSGGCHWGTGRRKNAVARVRVRPGSGEFVVNGKVISDYFPRGLDQAVCRAPLNTLETAKKVDVFVNTHGGGNTGQAGAIRMGLGRALLALYPDAHRTLAEAGHFTRDPRMVERKKYGRHGARRGHQWGKR
jgi:small subunit ribosomal protein S9